MAKLINEIVGTHGAYNLLDRIYRLSNVMPPNDLAELVNEANISQEALSELIDCGIFIGLPDGFYMSTLGQKITLLLRGINDDEELSELFRKLTFLYPDLKRFELVTSDVTGCFIDSLTYVPNFISLYICSPWIRLDKSQLDKIEQAVLKARQRYPKLQIFIITLPKKQYRNWPASIETFKTFRNLGAEIVVNTKLHAKLYISEPGPYGGTHYAILGSENLTGRKNLELAIKVASENDILKKLTDYFRDIKNESEIMEEI